jgi:exonuclease SbcC
MIPIKLSVRNFMCYGDNVSPLDFQGLHVACLCGDNGNGKSALLDAMTWALWGKARAKTDDELIHLGRTEMAVEFEFALEQERYRVIRKRTRPGVSRAGHPFLDLQIAAGHEFRSIAGNSIRETEQRIIEILRMDYDTFTNSAYLLQGHADEFTKKLPSQRKQILADILALSRYDELEERAKGHARWGEGREKVLDSEIKTIDEELLHKGEYENELREIGEAIAEQEEDRRKQEEVVNALARQKSELDIKRQQLREIEERIKQAQETISSFEGQVREHRQRVERYEKVLEGYEEEMAKVHAQLADLVKAREGLEEKRESAQKMSNRIHLLTSTNAHLKEEMRELRGKIDMLAQEEAKCPLCGTELGVEGRERIMENYEAEGQEKKKAFRNYEDEARRLESESKALNGEISTLEGKIREGQAQFESQQRTLNKEHAEAEVSLPQEREALERAEEALGRWLSTLEGDTARLESLKGELAGFPKLEAGLSTAQKDLDDMTRRQARARQIFGGVQEKLQRCATLEHSREGKRVELEGLLEEKDIYDELAAAFSKKGIQALIIDTALPEIEEEANRLLARMTDNRMHVKMETQRAYRAKREESIETLDINISDELGMRRYEMYSGGEAFRIDFALRIALSKLLARRAGAPLSTLIIDEGFGTQDSSGREKLVEAINSIQDDFDKILVITHIEELKDAFPSRIEVIKTAEGSIIEMS